MYLTKTILVFWLTIPTLCVSMIFFMLGHSVAKDRYNKEVLGYAIINWDDITKYKILCYERVEKGTAIPGVNDYNYAVMITYKTTEDCWKNK